MKTEARPHPHPRNRPEMLAVRPLPFCKPCLQILSSEDKAYRLDKRDSVVENVRSSLVKVKAHAFKYFGHTFWSCSYADNQVLRTSKKLLTWNTKTKADKPFS